LQLINTSIFYHIMYVCIYIINSIPVSTHADDVHKVTETCCCTITTRALTYLQTVICSFINQNTPFNNARTPNTRAATCPLADKCCQQVPPRPFSKLLVIFEAPSRQSRHRVLVRLMFCTLTLTNMTPLAQDGAGCMYSSSWVHVQQLLGGCTAALGWMYSSSWVDAQQFLLSNFSS
jgi:hypothetical protein